VISVNQYFEIPSLVVGLNFAGLPQKYKNVLRNLKWIEALNCSSTWKDLRVLKLHLQGAEGKTGRSSYHNV
jgi:hypothetical protein